MYCGSVEMCAEYHHEKEMFSEVSCILVYYDGYSGKVCTLVLCRVLLKFDVL